MSADSHHTVLVKGALGQPDRLRRPYFKLTSGRGRDALGYRGSDDVVTIGSHASNQLVLPQATISRFHARIELDPTGYRLVDLESTNGTFVNGLRVGSAYITHKAKLRFGDVDVVFEVERSEAELGLGAGDRWGGLIGRSASMRRIFDQLDQAAPTESTVLLTGETGVGKDLIAQEIHAHSPRRNGPFVVVDCGSLPGNLIDSELFGHERGAFTGADQARAGAFEEARGGTLFLDEIGELPLPMQVRLLRAIEDRKVKRVGSDRWQPIDVRLVAATHRDLPRMCNQRLFREDLYYRISVIVLRIPALRERTEDISLLAANFITDAGGTFSLDAATQEGLTRRRWPGNVRELRNLIERALAMGPAGLVDEEGELPAGGASGNVEEPYKVLKARAVEAFERAYLAALLTRHHGNIAVAARAGELDPAWIYRLAKRYGLDTQSFPSTTGLSGAGAVYGAENMTVSFVS